MSSHSKHVALLVKGARNEYILNHGIDLINRSFTIHGTIDDNTFIKVDTCLTILEADCEDSPITIKINSGGGDLNNAWAIVSRMHNSSCPIITEAYGSIMSAATLIFTAGDIRRASKYCSFMFHQIYTQIGGRTHDIVALAKSLLADESISANFLADNSKKTVQYWKNLLNLKQDVYLTSEQVLNIGIAEEIF